ncbi:hypothetical protein NQ318_023249 [Aromia moschata]|uniref:Uncharacterized protein n=1 Tax=Aromia moschata TaxID=1265417 RepID=A0AAV8XLH5_9CUCU|nr:hypothetical protein NQ318_023249 [Aromia moschata]
MKPYCRKQAVEDSDKKKIQLSPMSSTIFFTPINVKPETVDLIIWVCCCLHNYLRDEYIDRYSPINEMEEIYELPTQNMIALPGVGGFANSEGFQVRSQFTDYFKNKSRNQNKH